MMQAELKDREQVCKAKAKVVRLVHLYQFKFGEYFAKYMDVFFQKIWEIIAENRIVAGRESERLVFAIIKYVGEASGLPNYTEFLKHNLSTIFKVLVLPNIAITQEDIDEFEDEPETYIKNDLEESDQETRRRYCMKFVQTLSKRYPQEFGQLVGELIGLLNSEYE